MNETSAQNNDWLEFEPLSARERFGITLVFLGSIAGNVALGWTMLKGFLLG